MTLRSMRSLQDYKCLWGVVSVLCNFVSQHQACHRVDFSGCSFSEGVHAVNGWMQGYPVSHLHAESLRAGPAMCCPHPHCFRWASHSMPTHPCQSGEWELGELLTCACYFPVCLMILPSLSLLPPSLLSLPPAQHLLSPPCLLASLQLASASPCVWKCPRRPRRCRATPWSCAASPAWRGRRWRPPRWWNGSTGPRAVKISLYVWLLTLAFPLLASAVLRLAPDSLGEWRSDKHWLFLSKERQLLCR